MKNTPKFSNKMTEQQTVFKLTSLQIALFCAFGFANIATAAQLSLSQAPPGDSNQPPIPNVIVTADDSGSMGECYIRATGVATGIYAPTSAGICVNPLHVSGIQSLREALAVAFSPANLPPESLYPRFF